MKRITTFRKTLVLLPGSLLIFLLQTCVMTYFPVYGVTGSLMIAFLGIVVVSCGKKGAFCASALLAILCECMISNVKGLYIIAFPVFTMAWAQAFADKSERQRERQALTQSGRKRVELKPAVRILLCSGCIAFSFQVLFLGYVYLNGVALTFGHFGRAFLQILYTLALTVLLAPPIRAVLGLYKRVKIPEGGTV